MSVCACDAGPYLSPSIYSQAIRHNASELARGSPGRRGNVTGGIPRGGQRSLVQDGPNRYIGGIWNFTGGWAGLGYGGATGERRWRERNGKRVK